MGILPVRIHLRVQTWRRRKYTIVRTCCQTRNRWLRPRSNRRQGWKESSQTFKRRVLPSKERSQFNRRRWLGRQTVPVPGVTSPRRKSSREHTPDTQRRRESRRRSRSPDRRSIDISAKDLKLFQKFKESRHRGDRRH